MNITTRMTTEEIAEAHRTALRSGRVDLCKLLYAIGILKDANAIKDLIAKASRYSDAMKSMLEARQFAEALGKKHNTREPLEAVETAIEQFEGQYVQLTLQCLESYHSQRKEILWKMKSGKRQLASAQSTIRKMECLCNRYEVDPLKKCFDAIWGFWQDQLSILEQYSEDE
jgi:hypothetical protein